MTRTQLTLHGTKLSGHVHRARLLLSMLNIPYAFIDASAETRRSAAFRQLNPLGQVPVLQHGDLVLADSNAILVYLARQYAPGSNWLPDDPAGAAHVQRWLSIAAGELRNGPAAARMVAQFGVDEDAVRAGRVADTLLAFIDTHLASRAYLAAEHPTIADLACYSYIAHAPEGGIALTPYGAITAWLHRIEALPGFVPMARSAIPSRG